MFKFVLCVCVLVFVCVCVSVLGRACGLRGPRGQGVVRLEEYREISPLWRGGGE